MSNDVPPADVPQQQYSAPPPATKKDNTVMLVLSYLGILFLVPMLTEKDDPDVQWHAKHGMVLFIAEIILFVALGFLFFVLGFIPYIGWIISAFGCFVWGILPIGILVLHILCIMKATKGERMQIPLVTDYVSRF